MCKIFSVCSIETLLYQRRVVSVRFHKSSFNFILNSKKNCQKEQKMYGVCHFSTQEIDYMLQCVLFSIYIVHIVLSGPDGISLFLNMDFMFNRKTCQFHENYITINIDNKKWKKFEILFIHLNKNIIFASTNVFFFGCIVHFIVRTVLPNDFFPKQRGN